MSRTGCFQTKGILYFETQETAGAGIWSNKQSGGREASVEGDGQLTFWVRTLLLDWKGRGKMTIKEERASAKRDLF